MRIALTIAAGAGIALGLDALLPRPWSILATLSVAGIILGAVIVVVIARREYPTVPGNHDEYGIVPGNHDEHRP